MNEAKGMPVEWINNVVAGKADRVPAIGGAKYRDDQVGTRGESPDPKGLPEVFTGYVGQTRDVIRDPEKTCDAGGAIDDEFAGFLGRTGQFTLKHRINEADGKLKVVKEVAQAVPNRKGHDDGVSVRQGSKSVIVEPIVEMEHRSVKTLERITYFLHRNVSEIRAGGGSRRANRGSSRMFPGSRATRQMKEWREETDKYRVLHE